MFCSQCGQPIPPGYEFLCLICGRDPLCDSCYVQHVEGKHPEAPEGEE